MKKIALLFALLFTTSLLNAQNVTQVFKRFAVQSAVGQSAPFQFALGQSAASGQYSVINGFVPSKYTITITPTGTPATCTYSVKGTLKLLSENPVAADFVGGDISGTINCTVKTTIHITGKPMNTLLGEVLTLTGGSSPTVQVEILAMP